MELLWSSFALWLVWPSLVGLTLYWYLTKNYDYWEKQGVPSMPAVPLLGSIYSFLNQPLQQTEVEIYRKYGRIYGYYEGSRPILTVAEPHLVRDILVKDFQFFSNRRHFEVGDPLNDKMVNFMEGENWKRVRTIITPTFTTGKIKRMLNIFIECAKTLSQNFDVSAKEEKPIDAKVLFGAFTLDVIASSAFSTKLDSHNDPNNEFVTVARQIFSHSFSWKGLVFFVFPRLTKLLGIRFFSAAATKFFSNVTLQIIQERKSTGQVRNDFLQLLMDTAKGEVGKDEEMESAKAEKEGVDSNYQIEENNDVFKQNLKKKSLSVDEMVAQCVMFFLAGYDTTASTLSFVAYNLALNPDCQEKLIQEIDEALRNADVTYEAIQGMKYLDNVISETLRLFTPGIRLERRAEEDYKLGDTGITIPKGMIVGVPLYAMNRDPEFFPDPDVFDPQRFSPEEKSKRNPYMYIPFGAGPRNCIGMRFALIEIKVCIAYTLSHFRVRRCPETQVPLEFNLGAGLLQPKPILLKMEKRTDRILQL